MAYSDHMPRLLDRVIDAFGTTVTYDPTGATPAFEVKGVPEHPAQLEESFPESYLCLFVKLADFPVAPAKGDRVTIASNTYHVVDVQADAEGGARLQLHEIP